MVDKLDIMSAIKAEKGVEKQKAKKEEDEEKKIRALVERIKSEEGEFFGVTRKAARVTDVVQKSYTPIGGVTLKDFLFSSTNKLYNVIGQFYLVFEGIITKLADRLSNLSMAKDLAQKLDSSDIKFAPHEFLLAVAMASVLAALGGFIIGFLVVLIVLSDVAIALPVGIAFGAVFFAMALYVGITMPQSKMQSRADEVSRELPFALRQLSTLLGSGIGINTALASVVSADYGALSEEFARVQKEVASGTSMEEALKRMTIRVPSRGLVRAMSQVIRALKSGSKLADTMNMIADDIAFELRMKMGEFVERLNMIGLLYLFASAVIPVMATAMFVVAALMGLGLPLIALAGLYFILFMSLIMFLMIVRKMEPKV